MKLAWLHPHINQWNGGVRHIFEVAKRLRKRCEVNLYVGKTSPSIKNMFSNLGVEVEEICSLYYSLEFSVTNFRNWTLFNYSIRKASKELREKLQQSDILLSSYFPTNCVVARFNNPSIYMFFEPCSFFYDPYFIGDFSFMKRNLIKSFKQIYYRYDIEAAKKVSSLITITKFSASQAKKIYKRYAYVTYPGVDTKFFRRKYDSRLASRYTGHKIVLHSASYFTPSKGTHFLILAFAKVLKQNPRCKLLILNCVQNAEAKQRLMNTAKTLGILDNIEFLPFIEDQMLPCYYSIAHVVAQPSINESFRLPLHEGSACETPSVCFTGGSSEEEVVHGETGFIVPIGCVQELASAITTILKDPDLRKRMGQAGRKRVETLFNWDRTADGVWEVIEQVQKNAS